MRSWQVATLPASCIQPCNAACSQQRCLYLSAATVTTGNREQAPGTKLQEASSAPEGTMLAHSRSADMYGKMCLSLPANSFGEVQLPQLAARPGCNKRLLLTGAPGTSPTNRSVPETRPPTKNRRLAFKECSSYQRLLARSKIPQNQAGQPNPEKTENRQT